MITKPTRVTMSSASLIDHIYTNNLEYSCTSGIVITDLADHFGIFHCIRGKSPHTASLYKQTRFFFTDANIAKFKSYLDQTAFVIFYQHFARMMHSMISSHYIKRLIERAFPLRSIKINKKFIKREPWLTPGRLTSSRNKAKLLKTKLCKPTELNTNKYTNFNNLFNRLMRIMKINYYHAIINENKFNIKKTWSIVKGATGKLNDKSGFPN